MSERTAAASLLVIGVGWAAYQSEPLRLALMSRRWPQAPGEVRYATVTTFRKGGASPALRDVEPIITVEYMVAGECYVTSRVRWTGVAVTQAVRTLHRYPPGSTVSVAYDPRDPRRAVLEPGLTFEGLMQVGTGVVAALAGLLWLVIAARGA